MKPTLLNKKTTVVKFITLSSFAAKEHSGQRNMSVSTGLIYTIVTALTIKVKIEGRKYTKGSLENNPA
ncbi:MAG: hypothetical protein H8E34_13815 [Bacteroidetes bacterium]|nr:hypothetical protein [Bacteroidota bacterium]